MSKADVAHLMNRVGFGATPAELAARGSWSRSALVDAVLDVRANPASTDQPGVHADPPHDHESEYWLWVSALHYWLDRMATVPAPLQEKMTLFWHGHFATEQGKVYDCRLMWLQNQKFRNLGLGRFDELLRTIAVDPAMLLYLDNYLNAKSGPQENFARELLELFTIGTTQFNQTSVVGTARAWTGHGIADPYTKAGRRYRFHPDAHDAGPKTIFGITRNWDGPDVLTEICTGTKQVPLARFLARKLWKFLAYPNPSNEVTTTVADAFVSSGRSITALVRAVVSHPDFWSDRARQALVRSPVEFMVAIMRLTGLRSASLHPEWWLAGMGQLPFNPPNVAGWPGGGSWLNASQVSTRASFARGVTWMIGGKGSRFPLNADVIWDRAVPDQELIERAFAAFGITEPTATSRAVLDEWLVDQRWTGHAPECLVTTMMCLPEFNVA